MAKPSRRIALPMNHSRNCFGRERFGARRPALPAPLQLLQHPVIRAILMLEIAACTLGWLIQ
jgi:hypothetical protein